MHALDLEPYLLKQDMLQKELQIELFLHLKRTKTQEIYFSLQGFALSGEAGHVSAVIFLQAPIMPYPPYLFIHVNLLYEYEIHDHL